MKLTDSLGYMHLLEYSDRARRLSMKMQHPQTFINSRTQSPMSGRSPHHVMSALEMYPQMSVSPNAQKFYSGRDLESGAETTPRRAYQRDLTGISDHDSSPSHHLQYCRSNDQNMKTSSSFPEIVPKSETVAFTVSERDSMVSVSL